MIYRISFAPYAWPTIAASIWIFCTLVAAGCIEFSKVQAFLEKIPHEKENKFVHFPNRGKHELCMVKVLWTSSPPLPSSLVSASSGLLL